MLKGTLISGIAASEHLDSSGERISIKGLDISSLERGEGVLNYEHKNENASHIVGKIIKAKKIFNQQDCETQNELYFWNKSQAPFLYIVGELFDAVGHQQAKEIASILKYDSAKRAENPQAKNVINFSIEGAKLEKNGSEITKAIARKTTITVTPCNKMAIAEELKQEAPKTVAKSSPLDMFKTEEAEEIQILEKSELPEGWLVKYDVAPSSLTGTQALSREEILKRKKSAIEETFKSWPKSDQLVKFFQKKNPRLTKAEATALAKIAAYKFTQKAEQTIEKMEKTWKPSYSDVGGKQVISFTHPQHGIVSVIKEGDSFHVKHAGAFAGLKGQKGIFNNPTDAVAHAQEYTNALSAGTVAPRQMHNMPSGTKLKAPATAPAKSPAGAPAKPKAATPAAPAAPKTKLAASELKKKDLKKVSGSGAPLQQKALTAAEATKKPGAGNDDMVKLYHITDKSRFKLDPAYEPQDNAISIEDRSGRKGIYTAPSVESWVNGHGYARPFVAELHVPKSVADKLSGRWGGEKFIPAEHFDKVRLGRVIPIDAHAREQYGEYGWFEGESGEEFDTGKKIDASARSPFKGYKYAGKDAREMSPEEVKTLRARFKAGYKARLGKSEELEKGVARRLFPWNPDRPVHEERKKKLKAWQDTGTNRVDAWFDGGEPTYQSRMPRNALMRGFNKLQSLTPTKMIGGERHFLLHRGDKATYRDTHNEPVQSSWTPHHHVADGFAGSDGEVHSAWVPESKIDVIAPQMGATQGKGPNDWAREHEVIVAPHANLKLLDRDFVKEQIKRPNDLNARINQRAAEKDRAKAPFGKAEELEKGVMSRLKPFNPKLVPKPEREDVQEWQTYGQEGASDIDFYRTPQDVRNSLEPMDPNARARGLNKLHSVTKVRKNPKTGEREFLLHRGTLSGEHEYVMGDKNKYKYLDRSSWTPDYKQAKSFTNPSHHSFNENIEMGEEHQPGHVISSWIPESKISHIPFMYGAVHRDVGNISPVKATDIASHQISGKFVDPNANNYRNEFEIIVDPHTGTHVPDAASLAFPSGPVKDINERISRRAQGEPSQGLKQTKHARAKGKLAASEPLMKPFRSEAQRRWAHTPKGTEALGGKEAVARWDKETKGKKLPEKVEKKDRIPGGLADKKDPKSFNPKSVKEGQKVEMEHTSDKEIAREIARDHLTEDKNYYKKLKTIEKK